MKFPLILMGLLFLVQFLIYHFAKVLIFQFKIHTPRSRKILMGLAFGLINIILLISMIRSLHLFRVAALILVGLWFVFLANAVVFVFRQFSRKIPKYRNNLILLDNYSRILLPICVLGIFGLAWYNAYVPVVKHISVKIDKPLAQPVRIGMAADTHLGVLVGARQLDKLAQIFQSEQVDIILLPGDIMDDNTLVYEAENMQPHLAKLRAPLGVYATLGNHDLFGAEKQITQAIEKAGITVLHDDVLKIDQRFWLVGRPDELDRNRAQTTDLLKKVNTQEPVFLLDHRPDSIVQHSELPIDVQVSGHVHKGQIFPMNFLVKYLNRLHYGYEKIGNGHFVVTSGYGFWGVPFRLASQSEVWVIDVSGR